MAEGKLLMQFLRGINSNTKIQPKISLVFFMQLSLEEEPRCREENYFIE